LKSLGQLPATERGRRCADQRNEGTARRVTARRVALADARLAAQLAADALDVSLPGRGRGVGALHPLTRTLERVERLFRALGFDVADGPEIEDDFHNFTALNTPENHPARSMHDTFYVEGGMVLRTHTSPIQIRYMETHRPPVKIIAPGRVYRVDSDATHSPMFHQVEGVVDRRRRVVRRPEERVQRIPAQLLRARRRDAAVSSVVLSVHGAVGGNRHALRRRRWLEIAGAGQVHPNVLRAVNIDPERWQGFAFGMGPDRLAMLRYGVDDLRLFTRTICVSRSSSRRRCNSPKPGCARSSIRRSTRRCCATS
jgi:phenylalanyl-tRNA synthetase alpha chain